MKKKICAIGDLHGKWVWKKVDLDRFDKVVVMGDYCDSFTHSDGDISSNLLEIVNLKKDNPEKVHLLIGNHDFGYIFRDEGFYCSGFRPSMKESLWTIFNENRKLFEIAYQEGDYLFSHAGIHSVWYRNHKDILNDFNGDYAYELNCAFNSRHYPIFYDVHTSRGGTSKAGSPLWADKSETANDNFPINQVVGHSRVGKVITVPAIMRNGYSITFTDCLDIETADFLELEV